ncbi:unnamed protein product [Cuscuta campestris]|uniref:CCHC-type domain-containing protein n=1 Tax=Cuscuta campestris TaxID=132261 RepID=A0A484N559_9ASTE|nr:unnamed protein product [Cuscuta campestris]
MASNNTNSHSINLRYILESQKLSGENFIDWELNLRIVLELERKLYILDKEPSNAPVANARAAELASYQKYEDDKRDVKCIILASMIPELQRLHNDMEARTMMQRLRDLYQAEYGQTVVNFYMNKLDMTLAELLKFLTTAEESLGRGKAKPVLMVEDGALAKGDKAGAQKKKKKVAVVCYHCGKKGQWRRNCAKLMAERKAGKHPVTSGIYVIEVNMSDFTAWVIDTGCGSHIYTSMQDLHEVRQLTEGEVQLRVGNGAVVNALAVGTYNLPLPSRNIISVSCLDKAGYSIVPRTKIRTELVSCLALVESKLIGMEGLENKLWPKFLH